MYTRTQVYRFGRNVCTCLLVYLFTYLHFLQQHFQLDLIAQRDVVLADEWDGRLEFACFLYGVHAQLAELKTAFLIKAQRAQIRIGGGDVDAAALIGLCFLDHFLDERRPDAFIFTQAVNGDDLTIGIQKCVGDETDPIVIVQREKTAHVFRLEYRPMRNNEFRIPVVVPELAYTRDVCRGEAMDGCH